MKTVECQELVDALIASNDVAAGRPTPFMIFRAMEAVGVINVREVVNVGDTVLDLRAGYNARVSKNVGVLSGCGTYEELSKINGATLIASIVELPRLGSRNFHESRDSLKYVEHP